MAQTKKLNIGVFIDVYYPMIDGVLKVLETHVHHLKDRFNIHLVVPSAGKNYVYPELGEKTLYPIRSVKIFFLDYRLSLPRLDRGLLNHLNNLNLDLIIVHSPFAIGEYGLRWAKKYNVPALMYAHTQLKAEILGITRSRVLTAIIFQNVIRVYQLATNVIAVGEGVAHIYEHDYKLGYAPLVINNATDLRLLQNKRLALRIKKNHGITDQFVFSFLGRMHKLKNIYFTADALKIVKEHGINFKMFFIGDGTHLKDFKKYVTKIGLADNVIFLGKLKERELIAAYLHISHLFLFPSLNDTNSLVQKEAASQKTPSLFIEGATTAFGFTEGIHCFFAPNDRQAYARKIIELVEHPTKLRDIRESVYKNVYRTWEESIEQLYALINDEVAKNKQK